MFIVLNIVLIALVLLIGYWWANQGLFSAILHLICVVAAGAVAISVWEPIVVGFLLRGNGFDDYAWGVTLIMVFAVTLFLLRFAMDKVAPGNVDLPRWANMGIGFPVGAAAGVITMGMVVIGAGFIQSNNAIMDFRGKARADRGATIQQINTLWAPVHVWTSEFYSFLSVGSLYPTFNDTPLRHYNPDLHFQAASLIRDSAMKGRGKLSLQPTAATVESFFFDPNAKKYLAQVKFFPQARDAGEQLTLSSSQIRLIGNTRDFDKPKAVHPDHWIQYDGLHKFDDASHYVTSEPGQSEANVILMFSAAEFATPPKFLQIRNTRFRLPAPQDVSTMPASGMLGSAGRTTVDQGARSIESAVRQTNDIRPISVGMNQKPPGISVTTDLFIDGGEGEFAAGLRAASRKLAIQGIFEPGGTRIVQVEVGRESPANIFGLVQDRAGANAKIMLVDSLGRSYSPVGYMHQRADGSTRIKLDFGNPMDTHDKIPAIPTAGGQPLKLIFAVTVGATVTGLKLGDVTIGTCNLPIVEEESRRPPTVPVDTVGDAAGESEN